MQKVVRCNWGTHRPVLEVGVRKGCAIELGYRKDDPYTQWVVEYAGNGHYFKTARECMEYCKRRGWVKTQDEIDRFVAEAEANAEKLTKDAHEDR